MGVAGLALPAAPRAAKGRETPRNAPPRPAASDARPAAPRAEPRARAGAPRGAAARGWNPTAFALVLTGVPKAYYDPSRLRPRRAFVAGAARLERAAVEIVVSAPDKDGVLEVQVRSQRRRFATRDLRTWMQMGDRLLDVLRFADRALGDPGRRDALQYAAIKGVLSVLDPHTTFFTPEEYRRQKSQFTGSRVGIGVTLTRRGKEIVVRSVASKGPADRAGIRPGDVLLQVDALEMSHLTPFIAARRLEGDPGTRVRVVVRRGPPPGQRFSRTLRRQVVVIPSVTGKMLPGRIALLTMTGVPKNLLASFEKALAPLRSKHPHGWILDLRHNEGGYIQQAARVADFFLPEGLLCLAKGRGGQHQLTWRIKARPDRLIGPVVALVDARTASAAEILAGALSLGGRALLLGERTWGKGTVQKLVALPDGSAVKLTMWQYLVLGRYPIQASPIVPDVELLPVSVAKDNIRLLAAGQARREASQAHHVDAEAGRKAWVGRPVERVRYLLPRVQGNDLPLDLAVRLLHRMGGAKTRAQMLAHLRRVVDPIRVRAKAEIVAALRARGIHWDAPPAGAQAPRLEARFDPPFSQVRAGHTARIRLTVRNTGAAPAYQVGGRLTAYLDAFDGREILVGKVAPGATVTRTLEAPIPKGIRTRLEWIRVTLRAANGGTRPHAQASVRIQEAPRPRLRLSWQVDDRKTGSGDGRLAPGERATLRLVIRNEGPEKATALRVDAVEPSGCVVLGQARLELGSLGPGQETTAQLPLTCRKAPTRDKPGLRVTVYDRVLGGDLSVTLELPRERRRGRTFAPAKGSATTKTLRADLATWAGPEALRVGHVPAGTLLVVQARRGDWLRVGGLPNGRFAFVTTEDVRLGPPGKLGLAKLDPTWTVVPPAVSLGPLPEVTRQAEIVLDGHARSHLGVQDVWVRRWNPESPHPGVDKVLYHLGPEGGLRHLRFRAHVPLAPGTNYLVADARDVAGVVGQVRAAVYRPPAKDTVTPRPKAPSAPLTTGKKRPRKKAGRGCHCTTSSSSTVEGAPAATLLCLWLLGLWIRGRRRGGVWEVRVCLSRRAALHLDRPSPEGRPPPTGRPQEEKRGESPWPT